MLAWYDSLLLATILATLLGWAWLMTWCKGSLYTGTARLDGKLAVVTGANIGIGKAAAREFLTRGARVVLACRNTAAAEATRAELEQETGIAGKLVVMHLDLSSFQSVRDFAAKLCAQESKLDILVNNAGVAFFPRTLTEDGEEQVMQVNHLSNFLLTNLLADLLAAAPSARVVMTSSLAHEWADKGIQFDDLKWETTKWDSWQAYGQSKLANILFAKEFGRKYASEGITTYSVHPGAVHTELGRNYKSKVPAFLHPLTDLSRHFLKTPEGGAATLVYCAVEPSLASQSGQYYADCAQKAASPLATDDKAAKKLWKVSKAIVGDMTPLKPVAAGKQKEKIAAPKVTLKSDLLADIETFEPEQSLNVVKTPEPMGGAELLKQELLVDSVESFDKSALKKTETNEPLTGSEMAKNEMNIMTINKEVKTFDKTDLKETVVEEKIFLPDQTTIEKEKDKIQLIGGIENFDVDNLAAVKTREPLSGADILKQEITHQAIHSEVTSFNQEELKKTIVEEKIWMPDNEAIKEEKEKVEHLTGIESFKAESLTKVTTQEPFTGAELLKQELTQKAIGAELENFNKESMNPVNVEEKNSLPDSETLQTEKTRENILRGVEDFAREDLSHVKAPEPLSGTDLLKQELSIKSINESVETFDSSLLKETKTEEKLNLPDAETIQSEKVHVNLMRELETGMPLSPVIPKEPLSGVDLLKQELTHQQVLDGVSTFDKESLKVSELEEKSILPDAETIESEKSHLSHLKNIDQFDVSALNPVRTAEPLTGPEVSKQESLRSNITEQLVAFDK